MSFDRSRLCKQVGAGSVPARSGGLYAIGVDMVGRQLHPDQPHAFFDQVDRGSVEGEPVVAAQVAFQDEASAVAQQQAGFVDGLAAQSVASIARAARSGSSAWVIGRPMTRIEAP